MGGVDIGTCGFGISRDEYLRKFSCVEVQHTFYQPPQISTLERWRTQIPDSFNFTIKAWQLITHDSRSPTYRRLKKKLSPAEKAEAGYFRRSSIVAEAWQETLNSARALKAKVILFQCPASFESNKTNISNMEVFFSTINREAFSLGWEPRGNWDRKLVKDLCGELRLWHVVDPLVGKTTTPDHPYFRLHGKSGWRYEYEDAELVELALSLPKHGRGYVFFNNVSMIEDALRFQKILLETKSLV